MNFIYIGLLVGPHDSYLAAGETLSKPSKTKKVEIYARAGRELSHLARCQTRRTLYVNESAF